MCLIRGSVGSRIREYLLERVHAHASLGVFSFKAITEAGGESSADGAWLSHILALLFPHNGLSAFVEIRPHVVSADFACHWEVYLDAHLWGGKVLRCLSLAFETSILGFP